ncbi:hypothetical protein Ccrd_024374, partial [Cynara cardunculus var. scolymus]
MEMVIVLMGLVVYWHMLLRQLMEGFITMQMTLFLTTRSGSECY